MLPLILASSSPYRRQLLMQLGLKFESCSPNINETPSKDETVSQLVLRLAKEKAYAIAKTHPAQLIIGSDQVASLNGAMLTKPGSKSNAIKQLSLCSGKQVTFHTSLALLNSATGVLQLTEVCYDVHFRQLSNEAITRYVDAELPLDCAGSFKMEGLGITLFEKLSGNDPNALIGLPLIQLTTMLHKEGVLLP